MSSFKYAEILLLVGHGDIEVLQLLDGLNLTIEVGFQVRHAGDKVHTVFQDSHGLTNALALGGGVAVTVGNHDCLCVGVVVGLSHFFMQLTLYYCEVSN